MGHRTVILGNSNWAHASAKCLGGLTLQNCGHMYVILVPAYFFLAPRLVIYENEKEIILKNILQMIEIN